IDTNFFVFGQHPSTIRVHLCSFVVASPSLVKHITGIGGIFFKANDPAKLAAWYKKHLGLEVEDFGGVMFRDNETASEGPKRQSYTLWSPFPAETDYFAPSEKPFMINFRVADRETATRRSQGGRAN